MNAPLRDADDKEAAPPTLAWFAYLVAGPRDLVINAAINAPIAWYFYGAGDDIGFSGEASLLPMLVPMTLILSFFTTFFGYLAGTQRRKTGLALPRWQEGTSWLKTAVIAGVVCAAVALAACLGVVWLVNTLAPDFGMTGWMATALIGVYSGLLAYVLHVRAVLASAQIGVAPDSAGNDGVA